MYDFLYKRKRTVQIILGLITLPFAFFGVDYYFRGGGDRAGEVARVAGTPITQGEFDREIRRELMLGPVQESIVGGNIVARTSVERYLGLLDQQREAAATAIDADAYLKDVKIDDAAVKAFYDANPAAFQVPEEVKLEYVTLSPETLGAQIALDPAEVRKQYDDNARLYGKAEERQAAHILITVKPDASEDEKTNAKKKAADIAAQARKNPAQF